MDYAQFKDYGLTTLFIKYVSDKYDGKDRLITIPKGATFEDMVALKGQKDIGDKIKADHPSHFPRKWTGRSC